MKHQTLTLELAPRIIQSLPSNITAVVVCRARRCV